MQDSKVLTLSMWIDYCIQYNNDIAPSEEKPTIRMATQADFDNFTKL